MTNLESKYVQLVAAAELASGSAAPAACAYAISAQTKHDPQDSSAAAADEFARPNEYTASEVKPHQVVDWEPTALSALVLVHSDVSVC